MQLMVDFPKIISSYFDLVNDLLTSHPDKFLQFPADVQNSVIQSLLFGVTHSSSEVANTSLRTLYQLAVFYIQLRSKQKQRGENSAWAHMFSLIERLEPDIRRFQQVMLQLLMCERFAESVVDAVADSLFALIVADASSFMQLVESVVLAQFQQQQSVQADFNSTQARIQSAFQQLLSANEVNLSAIDRKNRFKFRTNVREFLQSARSILSQR